MPLQYPIRWPESEQKNSPRTVVSHLGFRTTHPTKYKYEAPSALDLNIVIAADHVPSERISESAHKSGKWVVCDNGAAGSEF
jgi:hypothetical protein